MSDIDRALDTLKSLLQTNDGKQTLNSLIQNLSGGGNNLSDSENDSHDEEAVPASAQSESNHFNLNQMSKYSNLLSTVQRGSNAPRMHLMSALRPYLSSRRQQRFNVIMNLLKYSDVPAALMGRRNKR